MYICVTHVDSITKIPCDIAPMSHGPSLPDLEGLIIEWANETEWPTNKPLFYGICDDTCDLSISGVVKQLSEIEYNQLKALETELKSFKVRNTRNNLLMQNVDTINPVRWELLTEEEKVKVRVYRNALLDVTKQESFPWSVSWPNLEL